MIHVLIVATDSTIEFSFNCSCPAAKMAEPIFAPIGISRQTFLFVSFIHLAWSYHINR
jgi:hypothetical protein